MSAPAASGGPSAEWGSGGCVRWSPSGLDCSTTSIPTKLWAAVRRSVSRVRSLSLLRTKRL
eukprot:2978757-Amphidinium_carterae.1